MITKVYTIYILGLSAAQAALLPRATTLINYLPLGDSITEKNCWRPLLYDHIVTEGLSEAFQFVGSNIANPNNCTAHSSNYINRHEGHSGWTAPQIAAELGGWLEGYTPDVAQFMLGANDVVKNVTIDETFEAFTGIVRLLRKSNPRVAIIVDKMIPRPSVQTAVDEINDRIPVWAKGANSTRSPITVVDSSKAGGFNTSMLKDGIHPNAKGDVYLAHLFAPTVFTAIRRGITLKSSS